MYRVLIFFLVLVSCDKPSGCMDSSAMNYSKEAEVDDGSCTYRYSLGNILVRPSGGLIASDYLSEGIDEMEFYLNGEFMGSYFMAVGYAAKSYACWEENGLGISVFSFDPNEKNRICHLKWMDKAGNLWGDTTFTTDKGWCTDVFFD